MMNGEQISNCAQDVMPAPIQDGDAMNVLLIGDSERVCWHLARHLEKLGCGCWFASTPAEIRTLLERFAFRLVLSTRPVTEGSPLMEALRGPERTVFYSYPVEDGCLWFQAIPEVPDGRRFSALRPSEFMSVLANLCGAVAPGGR